MSPFQQLMFALTEEVFEQLTRGELGLACDETGYHLVPAGMPLPRGANRAQIVAQEQPLLAQFYSKAPLGRAEFDYQADRLIAEQGVARFCRHAGNLGHWALMIDDWGLIAVGPEDVRSQYGYYCEADGWPDEAGAEASVLQWLKSGQAYEDYRSKTHCRYCQ